MFYIRLTAAFSALLVLSACGGAREAIWDRETKVADGAALSSDASAAIKAEAEAAWALREDPAQTKLAIDKWEEALHRTQRRRTFDDACAGLSLLRRLTPAIGRRQRRQSPLLKKASRWVNGWPPRRVLAWSKRVKSPGRCEFNPKKASQQYWYWYAWAANEQGIAALEIQKPNL